MSGDVQPRKRKDKKRKKDELGVEEPRGTAAALGEGDVFMHSQHEHGTGGHWCAKIIFFSLLAVLVTLIGLIILENRGLSDLEANSVESRYSGVLEGWLEDPADDDHHDEHTLELLKQHEHEEHEEEEGDSEIEVEKLEKEVSDDDAASEEQPSHEEDESQEEQPQEDDGDSAADEVDDTDSVEDEEFLEADDLAEPPRIVAPKGRPLVEVEDEPTTAKPVDTLADEEEYEKQQEELRQEQEQASHVWLKLSVGGALLVATYAVVSRAAAPRDEDDTPASEGHASREDTPSSIDRRMTLISVEATAAAQPDDEEEILRPKIEEKVFETFSPVIKSAPATAQEDSEEEYIEEEEELIIDTKDVTAEETPYKELYSDEEEPEEVEEEEVVVVEKKEADKQAAPIAKKAVEPEPEPEEEAADEDDVGDDVEIIDDEHLEEEEEEGDDEEEISDVDDAELLNRLEAKYGRLPEPERPGQKQKDGGNSIEDDWPGEPSDKYWRQQLDEAEQQLRQDWLD